ncbi:hypothetical protein ACFYZM_30830 [Streptomyces nondiastaticus]|uniref:Uncharacterized protein n=1 Tax=Streptomyces nondiastaticus TaxID=3154512 RepID=A0ABW6U951_9ACTN
MAFGKRRTAEEAAVPAVAWANVHKFTISSMEKPTTPKRNRAVRGQRAVRVPRGGGNYRVYAPCAYLAPASRPAPPGSTGPRLYEDPEAQNLLCYLELSGEDNNEKRYSVRDGQGELIGAVRRIASSRRFLKHTWRIDQPGHPEIVGRNQWAAGSTKELAELAATKVVLTTFQIIADMGAEGGDQPPKPRTLEWKSDGKLVMTSEGSQLVTIKADWLDRRLAFAFALIGDA